MIKPNRVTPGELNLLASMIQLHDREFGYQQVMLPCDLFDRLIRDFIEMQRDGLTYDDALAMTIEVVHRLRLEGQLK